MLLCRTGPYPANQAKPGLLYFYPAVATHLPLPFCKNLLCPALALRATIVLPDFTRSCSADGNYLSLRAIAWQPRRILYVSDEVASSVLLAMTFWNRREEKRAKARQKARAWVFCLWGEGSFCLDFLFLLYQDKRNRAPRL